jgi:hypothetical protein
MTKHYTDLELMTWRPVKNVGSATINPREVCLVCTGGDSLDRSITAVKQPTSTAGKTYCVNGPTPIAASRFGRACFGPVVLVKYDTGSPATDDRYGWKDGQGTVVKDSNALFNVLRVVDTTNKLMLGAIFTSAGICIGKLDGSLSQGSYATVSKWTCAGGSFSDTGDNVTAYDWLMKSGATAIASGKKVVYVMIGDTMVILEAECP